MAGATPRRARRSPQALGQQFASEPIQVGEGRSRVGQRFGRETWRDRVRNLDAQPAQPFGAGLDHQCLGHALPQQHGERGHSLVRLDRADAQCREPAGVPVIGDRTDASPVPPIDYRHRELAALSHVRRVGVLERAGGGVVGLPG